MGNEAPDPVGVALTRLRLDAGLSARQAAQAAGVSVSSVIRAERGQALTRPIIDALAGVLGESVHEFTRVAREIPPDAVPALLARHERGLSRAAAAKLTGVSPDVLARAEAGRGVHPANARRIALAYGLSVADVLPLKDDNDHSQAA